MRPNRTAELTEYFARLGLAYGGDRHAWHRNGSDWINGPYRGVMLHVQGERDRDGKENTGEDYGNPTYRPLYRNYLQVAIEMSPPVPQPLIVLPRNEYALLTKDGLPVVNGKVIVLRGENIVGKDLMHSRYLAVNRMLDSGVPAFDATFGVLCDDEAHARALLRPDLAGWIAADRRSYGARLMFRNDRVHAFYRSERSPEPAELFVPERIFPAADYLIDLLGRYRQSSPR